MVLKVANTAILLLCLCFWQTQLTAQQAEQEEAPARPVLVVQISQAALTKWIDREVTRTTPVDTCFHDTHVVGQAYTVGRPSILLPDNEQEAAFEMVFSGTTKSKTTGFHDPVTLYGHSDTKFVAKKRIVFQPGKGFRSLPATIQVDTKNYLDNICTHRRGIIGRIIIRKAWAQADAQRCEALEFARSNAKRRILDTFDRLLEAKLVELNKSVELRYFAEDFFGVKLPPIYQTSTKNGYVQLAISSKPGTPVKVDLPRAEGETKPLQMWLHSSLLGPDVKIGLAMLQEAERGAESVLGPEALAKPPQLLPPIEIAPGVKPPPPKQTGKPKPTEVIWGNVKDWLVIQFEGDRVAEELSKRRAAAKAKEKEKGAGILPGPPTR